MPTMKKRKAAARKGMRGRKPHAKRRGPNSLQLFLTDVEERALAQYASGLEFPMKRVPAGTRILVEFLKEKGYLDRDYIPPLLQDSHE